MLRTYSIFERIDILMVCIGINDSVPILLLINAATATGSLKIPPIFSFDRTVIVGRAKERVDALISKERPGLQEMVYLLYTKSSVQKSKGFK